MKTMTLDIYMYNNVYILNHGINIEYYILCYRYRIIRNTKK